MHCAQRSPRATAHDDAPARLAIAAGTGPSSLTLRGGLPILRASVRNSNAAAAVVAESRTAASRLKGGHEAWARSSRAARANPS